MRRSFDAVARKGLDKALRAAHRVIAKDVASDIRGATVGTRQQRKAIKSIAARGEPTAAVIGIRNAVPFGIGAFMGSIRYKQFPAWVGTNWNLESGEGPYVVAPTIGHDLPKIKDDFSKEVSKALESFGLEVI